VTASVPDAMRDLFDEPALAHVSYLNDAGQIVTFPMWVDFDGTSLTIGSLVGSRKGQAVRRRPQVSVSIVSTRNPFHWLSVSGRVVDIQPDEDLAWIDAMSRKYVGQPYQRRSPREVFTIEIDRVGHSGMWGG
jgi:PPOX class probable F420-dependent enzyme